MRPWSFQASGADRILSRPSRQWHWRHSMFWRLVPKLFVVSSLGAAGLIVIGTLNENARMRKVLHPVEVRQVALDVLRVSPPLPNLERPLAAWCEDSLHVLSKRILSAAMADRSGDANPNSFHQALRTGRLAVTLRMASGATCTFPATGAQRSLVLREQMEDAARRPSGSRRELVDIPGGWLSVTTVVQEDAGARLTLGVQILSPLAKLMQPKALLGPLAVFILVMNILTALLLVFLTVRRIRRADQVALAWTAGELDARINDPGRDEFSRLFHKFDLMADTLAGVIQVKQSLAASEERNRLARDLHDSSKQRAFALNLQLSALQKRVEGQGELAGLVAAALMLTGQMQRDLDSVIDRLAAPTIAESGLRHVLAQGVNVLLAGSGIGWSLSLDHDIEQRLDAAPEVARQVLLITFEAVANALKHSRCSHCSIGGARTGNMIAWTISDNGSAPFPTNIVSKGMGLANMRLRANSLPGGKFTIIPEAGGATVRVIFYLPASDKP